MYINNCLHIYIYCSDMEYSCSGLHNFQNNYVTNIYSKYHSPHNASFRYYVIIIPTIVGQNLHRQVTPGNLKQSDKLSYMNIFVKIIILKRKNQELSNA